MHIVIRVFSGSTMRVFLQFTACCLFGVLGSSALGLTDDDSSPSVRADTWRRHQLDWNLSPESRVKDTPATVLKMFTEDGGTAPTAHSLTADERRRLSAAYKALPPLHRRIVGERLRCVSFLDGMPNTALTSTV